MNPAVKITVDLNVNQEKCNSTIQDLLLITRAAILVIATANKMDDLEETYSENMEKEEEIFLEGLQNKKSLGELEKEYSQKVKEIRRIYEKSLRKDLNEEKEREIKKAKEKIKGTEKEEKEYHVQNLPMDKNWEERKQTEITSWSYRTKRKIKNFIQVATPNFFIYLYYKTKRIVGEFFRGIKEFFGNAWDKISESILNSLSFIKDGFIKIISDMEKIPNIFKRKAKKDEKGDKKENADKSSDKKDK
jgi:hypothetical protein